MSNLKGFTLIEVLVVVLILAVLASLAIPRISQSATESKDAVDESNRAMLIRALEFYASNNSGAYPKDQKAFDSQILKSKRYFPHGEPACPYGKKYEYDSKAGEETITAHASGK